MNPLPAQAAVDGVWTVDFDHVPNGSSVHPLSDSIATPGRWITMNLPPANQITPGLRLNTVHVCLIPSGLHRGEVLVLDGNLTNYGVRAFQPWSIVNPYWPNANPNFWPGQPAQQYRFHNATIPMTAEGELFCGGHCWLADGRLLFAGGTKAYPIQTPTDPGGFVGSRYVYQWDPVPQAGDPFGRWYRMADLEAERWYPTVRYDGTTAHRGIVIGGTKWTQANGTRPVNSYEVVRVAAFNSPAAPQLLSPPSDFDRKPVATLPVGWPSGTPMPPLSVRQYWGPHVPAPISMAAFGDYPRIHALGILDPITGGGSAPRLFVSGFPAWGVRWAHDVATDPVFGTTTAGLGYEIGQNPVNGDTDVWYATSLLLPAAIGGIATQVVRIGGGRVPITNDASNLVETVNTNVIPSSWGAMPSMIDRRYQGNVVILPNGNLFAIGGATSVLGGFSLSPELFNGTSWAKVAPQAGPRDYHSAALLLPDGRVFVCGGESRWMGNPPGKDYAIWEPPYFHYQYGSVPPTGITVVNATTGLAVLQDQIGLQGMQYNQSYTASWTNALEDGITVDSVVLVRPAAVTHHDDGGQRLVRLVAWADSEETAVGGSIHFASPTSVLHAPPGWWMLFLVTSSGRPSRAYWVHLL